MLESKCRTGISHSWNFQARKIRSSQTRFVLSIASKERHKEVETIGSCRTIARPIKRRVSPLSPCFPHMRRVNPSALTPSLKLVCFEVKAYNGFFFRFFHLFTLCLCNNGTRLLKSRNLWYVASSRCAFSPKCGSQLETLETHWIHDKIDSCFLF